jgi:hypothetical protein
MHRDPLTGHGITDAFRDAELLARALDGTLTGALAEPEADRLYHQLRWELAGPLFETTVAMTRYPSPAEFLDLQFQANAAMEVEARFLAELAPFSTALAAA